MIFPVEDVILEISVLPVEACEGRERRLVALHICGPSDFRLNVPNTRLAKTDFFERYFSFP